MAESGIENLRILMADLQQNATEEQRQNLGKLAGEVGRDMTAIEALGAGLEGIKASEADTVSLASAPHTEKPSGIERL